MTSTVDGDSRLRVLGACLIGRLYSLNVGHPTHDKYSQLPTSFEAV